MEQKRKKPFSHYMRTLHRDIGFFLIGLTAIYCVSGIVLIYRDTHFLKREVALEKQLEPNLNESDLSGALHLRNLKVTKNEGETIYFEEGTYNKSTGVAQYTSMELPAWLNSLNKLHMTSSKGGAAVFATIFGVLLLFLAISSFWMFKPKTRNFRRGIYLAVAGLVFAIALLLS